MNEARTDENERERGAPFDPGPAAGTRVDRRDSRLICALVVVAAVVVAICIMNRQANIGHRRDARARPFPIHAVVIFSREGVGRCRAAPR